MDNKLAAPEAAAEPSIPGSSAAPEPSPTAGAGPARKKRRRPRLLYSRYPVPPRELAGKWVAWSRFQIVASGETLAEVKKQVGSAKIKGASYEFLPPLDARY